MHNMGSRIFVLSTRQTPLEQSSELEHRDAAELPPRARQWSPDSELAPVVTATTVQRWPLPHDESVQHASVHVPPSQRPLRHASGPTQDSPVRFVPTPAMPTSDAFTQ
jgi:hypothetical protein